MYFRTRLSLFRSYCYISRLVLSNKSILEYLQANGYHNAVDALREDLGLPGNTPDPTSPPRQLLERKWISVVRMQKKVRNNGFATGVYRLNDSRMFSSR